MRIWVIATLGRQDRGEKVLMRIEEAFVSEAEAREKVKQLSSQVWEKYEDMDYFCVRGVYQTELGGALGDNLAAAAKHPGLLWIEANMAKLPRGQWVAADADGLVATADSHEAVMALVEKRRYTADEVAVAYTDP